REPSEDRGACLWHLRRNEGPDLRLPALVPAREQSGAFPTGESCPAATHAARLRGATLAPAEGARVRQQVPHPRLPPAPCPHRSPRRRRPALRRYDGTP